MDSTAHIRNLKFGLYNRTYGLSNVFAQIERRKVIRERVTLLFSECTQFFDKGCVLLETRVQSAEESLFGTTILGTLILATLLFSALVSLPGLLV